MKTLSVRLDIAVDEATEDQVNEYVQKLLTDFEIHQGQPLNLPSIEDYSPDELSETMIGACDVIQGLFKDEMILADVKSVEVKEATWQ